MEWGDIEGDILLKSLMESLPVDTVLIFSAVQRLVLADSCNISNASLSLGLHFLEWNSVILDSIISTMP